MKKLTSLLFLITILFSCAKEDIQPTESEKNLTISDINSRPKVKCINPKLYYNYESVSFWFENGINPSEIISFNGKNYTVKFELTNTKYIIINTIDKTESEVDNYVKSITNDTITFDTNNKISPNKTYSTKFNYKIYTLVDSVWTPLLNAKGEQQKDSLIVGFYSLGLPPSFRPFDITVHNILKEIKIFNSVLPEIYLNYPDSTIALFSNDGLSLDSIKACVSSFKILKGGQEILSSYQKMDNMLIRAIPAELIIPGDNYQAVAEASYFKKSMGGWVPLLDNLGQPIIETKSIDFSATPSTSDLLPDYDIAYSYPIKNMFNFYKLEYDKGYIQFTYNIDKIPSINKNDLQINFYQHPYSTLLESVSPEFDADNKTIWFNIPVGLLNEKAYRIDVVSNGKVIYAIPFRSSIYNKFGEKFPQNDGHNPWLSNRSFKSNGRLYYFDDLCYSVYFEPSPSEGLSGDEVGYRDGKPTNVTLVRITPLVNQWDGYNNSIYKYIEVHASELKRYIKRDLSIVPFPPNKNVIFMCQILGERVLTQNEANLGVFDYKVELFYFANYMPQYWAYDFIDIQKGLRTDYASSNDLKDEQLKYIYNFSGNYLSTEKGDYSLQLDYVLPGKNIVTSSVRITINNPWN